MSFEKFLPLNIFLKKMQKQNIVTETNQLTFTMNEVNTEHSLCKLENKNPSAHPFE